MDLFGHHPAGHFGHVAQRPGRSIAGYRDQVSRLHAVECGAAHAAIGHLRGAGGQRSGRSIGKAYFSARRIAVDNRRYAPACIIDPNIARCQFAFPSARHVDLAHRTRPSLARVETQQAVAQCRRDAFLQLGIIGAADPQAARIDAVGAVLRLFAEPVDQAAANLLHIIAARARVEAGAMRWHRAQRLCLRLVQLRLTDPAILVHFAQRPVAPVERAFVAGRAFGAVICRPLGQDGEIRHLVQLQVAHILIEIGARRRLHAIGVPAEEYLIEIEFEDLLLGQYAFHAIGEDHLLHLARGRIFIADQQVLGDLLGDGRSALGALAGADLRHIVEHRAEKAGDIHAMMIEESLVLRRQISADQQGRIVAILQLDPALACIAVHGLAIDVAHDRGQRRLIFQKRRRIGQAAREDDPEQQDGEENSAERDRGPPEPAPLPQRGKPFPEIPSTPAQTVGKGQAGGVGTGLFHDERRL